MAKPLAASKKVMKNYLSELMTEDSRDQEKPVTKTINNAQVIENTRLEALLKNVNADLKTEEKSIGFKEKSTVAPSEIVTPSEKVLSTRKSRGEIITKPPKAYRQGSFQALFFNVAGLTIAVPLIELGGIHPVDKTTALMGKPDWFKGVMLYRDEKINVVDTALWVMPEKCDETLKNSLNYQYIIMLSDSRWGLSAENLVDTVVLQQDEVKWLDASSKRPWLAGLVKDKMCALLDVDSLIELLNEGSGINQLD